MKEEVESYHVPKFSDLSAGLNIHIITVTIFLIENNQHLMSRKV